MLLFVKSRLTEEGCGNYLWEKKKDCLLPPDSVTVLQPVSNSIFK